MEGKGVGMLGLRGVVGGMGREWVKGGGIFCRAGLYPLVCVRGNAWKMAGINPVLLSGRCRWDLEGVLGVLGDGFAEFFEGDVFEFGEGAGGVEDVLGEASLAAVDLWCEMGCVGFDEEAVRWDGQGGVAEGLGLGEGHVAREGNVQAAVRAFSCKGGIASEAVDDAGGEAVQERLEQGKGIVIRLAVVYDGREAEFAGEFQLPLKGGVLCGAGREFVVVVEADFADRHDVWVGGELAQFIQGIRIHLGCVIGMKSDGGVDPVPGHGNARAAVGQVVADHHDPVQDFQRLMNHGFAIFVKARVLQMAMGVHQPHQVFCLPGP